MQANMLESLTALRGLRLQRTLHFGKGIIVPLSHAPFSAPFVLVGLRGEGSCAFLPETACILNIFVSLSSSLSLSISLHVSHTPLPESLQLVGALENTGETRPFRTASFSSSCFHGMGFDKVLHSKLCNDTSCPPQRGIAASICMTASAACMSEALVAGSMPMRRP